MGHTKEWQAGYEAYRLGFGDLGPYDLNTKNGAKKQKANPCDTGVDVLPVYGFIPGDS